MQRILENRMFILVCAIVTAYTAYIHSNRSFGLASALFVGLFISRCATIEKKSPVVVGSTRFDLIPLRVFLFGTFIFGALAVWLIGMYYFYSHSLMVPFWLSTLLGASVTVLFIWTKKEETMRGGSKKQFAHSQTYL
jgi:hypothetical protein